MALGSIRHHRQIAAPAERVWQLAGDATRLHEWFPGIVNCTVEGNQRMITLASGITLPEEIMLCDNLQRRFQYRITAPMMTYHRGTIDVLDMGDDTCVAVYTTDCDPRTMALVIGGGTAAALDELRQRMEHAANHHQ